MSAESTFVSHNRRDFFWLTENAVQVKYHNLSLSPPINTRIHFRLQLAAMYFNENDSREQAVTKKGEERYDILFPKYKKGGYIVRKVVQGPTSGALSTMHIHAFVHLPFTIPLPNVQPVGYIEELIKETMTLCSRGDHSQRVPDKKTLLILVQNV